MLNNRKIKLKIKEKEVIQKHITTDFIRLDAFLKLCDAVQSGGHAKIVIQDGEICFIPFKYASFFSFIISFAF